MIKQIPADWQCRVLVWSKSQIAKIAKGVGGKEVGKPGRFGQSI
jgi:hypothetical protein